MKPSALIAESHEAATIDTMDDSLSAYDAGDVVAVAKAHAANALRSVISVHRRGTMPDVFLFSTPRSGSTWLMELIACQPGFKYCNEPLNLRNPLVRRHLGIASWEELYSDTSLAAIEKYFCAYRDGRLKIRDPLPGRGWRRMLTHRIVFKIINGGEAFIEWFAETFSSRIVYLLRHPLAVALSRKEQPRLTACLNSDYRQHLTAKELAAAEEVVQRGSRLDRAIAAWCLENVVPLRQRSDEWLIVTYEQLVLDPEAVVREMALRLELSEPEKMLERLSRASLSTSKSDRRTQEFMKQHAGVASRRWLVEKWQDRVSKRDLRSAHRLLVTFGLDEYYRVDQALPMSGVLL